MHQTQTQSRIHMHTYTNTQAHTPIMYAFINKRNSIKVQQKQTFFDKTRHVTNVRCHVTEGILFPTNEMF